MLGVLLGCVLAVAAVVAATNAVTVLATKDRIVSAEAAASFDADAIVVLGASVYADGTPSGILQDRLDDGIALYFAGAAPKIIMSGDNSTVSYNEVKAMKDYAVAQGVPSEDVFCDHAGFSTYESMYRAKHVFGAERIVVATQTYHLYRALYAASGLGLEAVGVPSDYREYAHQLQYDVREIPARTKDFFKTLLRVPSTFVGDPISLDQSGDVTEG
ncbi:MAG TPA: YdcF family protein [Rubneribacter badeniensis]|uniref:YdcF family protein n=1 Tax=Rubneribacter badeniensis TaxID=2070688 RepID=A0A9D2VKA9_9ACTN|nr:YdcF family protein [Rubneribacter badeniensis]